MISGVYRLTCPPKMFIIIFLRSTLPLTMLGWVDYYRPKYVLMENVPGILSYPLKSEQDGRRLKGGIQMGMVKIILRILIALGYQVQVRVLQAAQYGAPQSRSRVIFWAARRGLKSPEFPCPTHAVQRSWAFKLPASGQVLPPVSRTGVEGEHKLAPCPAVTLDDAIRDLVCLFSASLTATC